MRRTVWVLVTGFVAAALAACGGPPAPQTPAAGAPPASGDGMFAGAQPWTADVAGTPASERSAAILAALNGAGGWGNGNAFQIDFGMPVLTADSATPRRTVVGAEEYCFGGPDCDAVPAEMPVPEGAHFEGTGDLTCDAANEDCHLLVVDREQRRLYEVYRGTSDGEQIVAKGFFVWDLDRAYDDRMRGPQCTSADAAGFPIAAMTPTADEVASGRIDHALRFVLPNDRMKAEVYVPPASHAGGPENTDPDAPPYGVHFRLRPDFDLSQFNEAQQVVLRTLQNRGMYLADGGEIALTFADDRGSTAKWADLGIDAQSFAGLTVDDFEVVDHGPEVPVTYACERIN